MATSSGSNESMPTPVVSRQNFGGNVTLTPKQAFVPRSEQEVLQILRDYRGRNIRVVGRLHSWSEAPLADDLLLDLQHLNAVHVRNSEDGPIAAIGAGCQIKRALSELARQGLTLPALGLISEQTLAGAVATATHGTGRHSVSHYVTAVRLGGYDEQGEPMIRELRDGPALEAAKCSLGCLGIVLSLELRPRSAYRIEEWLGVHRTLPEVLAHEEQTPLQQFYYLPWLDRYLGQHRRESDRPRSWLAPLYRAYWFVTIDLSLHLVLRFLVQRLRSSWGVKAFFRWLALGTVIRGWHVVDRSQDMLIMEHELFRHIEIELFVRRSMLPTALEFVRTAIYRFAGEDAPWPAETAEALQDWGHGDDLESGQEVYTHHYPVCVRRVLPDATLLSMTSGGDEDYYAISLISYQLPADRAGFFRFADFLAHSMAALFQARCHWGKLCPHSRAEIERLYPRLAEFRAVQATLDPQGVFGNDWTRKILSRDPASPSGLQKSSG